MLPWWLSTRGSRAAGGTSFCLQMEVGMGTALLGASKGTGREKVRKESLAVIEASSSSARKVSCGWGSETCQPHPCVRLLTFLQPFHLQAASSPAGADRASSSRGAHVAFWLLQPLMGYDLVDICLAKTNAHGSMYAV